MSGAQSVIVAVGSINAVGVLVIWRWRPWVRPKHRAPARPRLEAVPPVLHHTVPVAEVAGLPPWEVTEHFPEPEQGWDALTLAALHDAPTVLDDLGPGAGLTVPGYNSHLTSGRGTVKVDSPAPDDVRLLRPANATDLALARCDAVMVSMRASHARWMADARERWAA